MKLIGIAGTRLHRARCKDAGAGGPKVCLTDIKHPDIHRSANRKLGQGSSGVLIGNGVID